MATAKKAVRELDIQYHIHVREKVEGGRRAIEEGRVFTEEEAERRLSKWLGE